MHQKFHPDFRYQKVISRKSCRRLCANPSAGIRSYPDELSYVQLSVSTVSFNGADAA